MFIELKRQRGRLSAAQGRTNHQLMMAGAEVYVWKPSDWETAKAVLA